MRLFGVLIMSSISFTLSIDCVNDMVDCNGNCIDIQSDVNHCNACGHECVDHFLCCGGVCVNPVNDPRHCGECYMNCGNRRCENNHCELERKQIESKLTEYNLKIRQLPLSKHC